MVRRGFSFWLTLLTACLGLTEVASACSHVYPVPTPEELLRVQERDWQTSSLVFVATVEEIVVPATDTRRALSGYELVLNLSPGPVLKGEMPETVSRFRAQIGPFSCSTPSRGWTQLSVGDRVVVYSRLFQPWSYAAKNDLVDPEILSLLLSSSSQADASTATPTPPDGD